VLQSISLLEYRRVKARAQSPFLVVAPLTTLGHWKRELEAWTDMNVVCFMGSAADRQVIMDHEIHWRSTPAAGRPGAKTQSPKFHVMLTSFEVLRDCAALFNSFSWDVVVVDEAHRLKALQSATRCVSESHCSTVPCWPTRSLTRPLP
jgi:chromodomain-helicase-DNA-binding protein 7